MTNTQIQVAVTYTLAGYHYDQLMVEIQPKLESRSRDREGTKGLLPYPYFLPKNIPNSTSV